MHPWRETDTNQGGGSSGRLSSPTEATALKLTEDEDYIRLRKICRAVELLKQKTNDSEKGKVMQDYYFNKVTSDAYASSTMTNYRRWFKDELRKCLEEVEEKANI